MVQQELQLHSLPAPEQPTDSRFLDPWEKAAAKPKTCSDTKPLAFGKRYRLTEAIPAP